MSNIVLIGAPGAGKSTVGAYLASELSQEFKDTDVLIEEHLGKSVTDVFVVDGEPYFREIESVILKEVLLSKECVISLGGGAPIAQSSQEAISESDSLIVFLDVSLATAAPRVGFNRDRPLLLGNPRAQWQALSDKRRPVYEHLADVTIQVDGLSVAEITKRIRESCL